VNFWMQAYNLQVDQKTNRSDAQIEYEIVNTGTNKPVMTMKESSQQLGNVGDLVTLEKTLPLANVPSGQYQITIKVTDNISKQTISPTAKFAVVD
jgi:predicted phage tail protein